LAQGPFPRQPLVGDERLREAQLRVGQDDEGHPPVGLGLVPDAVGQLDRGLGDGPAGQVVERGAVGALLHPFTLDRQGACKAGTDARAQRARGGVRYPAAYARARDAWGLLVAKAVRDAQWRPPPTARYRVSVTICGGGRRDLDRVCTAVLDVLQAG